VVTKSSTLQQFKNNVFGLSDFTISSISTRLEVTHLEFLNKLPLSKWLIFLTLIQQPFPLSITIQKKTLANIFLLDLIGTYRGWRHIKGLPVRGQRT
jgi:ribosomal protein S13